MQRKGEDRRLRLRKMTGQRDQFLKARLFAGEAERGGQNSRRAPPRGREARKRRLGDECAAAADRERAADRRHGNVAFRRFDRKRMIAGGGKIRSALR